MHSFSGFIMVMIGFIALATGNLYQAWKIYYSKQGKPDLLAAFLVTFVLMIAILFGIYGMYLLDI